MSKRISSNQLRLKDWEMTKDRIKHFDDVVIKLRTGGIPIAVAIQAGGWAITKYVEDFRISYLRNVNAASLIFIFGLLYIFGIGLLDLVHYILLLRSVNHGKGIEQLPQFRGKLQITTKLTSTGLTMIHSSAALITYAFIGLIFAFSFILTK